MGRAGRLTSAADFGRTYASGRRASSRVVVVHAFDTGEERPARVGISAGRAIGGSVERNRAKRRIREAIRPIRASLAQGVDAVFVATPASVREPFQNLVDSAKISAIKAGALRG